ATLKDGRSGGAVANKNVTFTMFSQNRTDGTDSNGNAVVTYSAVSSSGSHALSAVFQADATYEGSSTNTIAVVLPRPMTIAVAPVTAYAEDVFTATATLTDTRDSGRTFPVNETVRFYFAHLGSTFTATTSGLSNVVTITTTAPNAFGSFNFAVTHLESSQYAYAVQTGTITVLRRPTVTDALDVTTPGVYADEVFTSTAMLTDVRRGTGVPNVNMSFYFANGGTHTVVTAVNPAGRAVTTYTAPLTAGPTQYTASFLQTPKYDPSSDTANVTVLRRPTNILTQPAAGYALEPVKATATLMDVRRSLGVAGKTVLFDFTTPVGSTSAVTAANGVAVGTHTVWETAGVYGYTARFNEDATYTSTQTTGVLTILKRPTSLSVAAATATARGVLVTTATLADVRDSSRKILNQSVTFYFSFDGSSRTATTNANGLAILTFTLPPATTTGTYRCDVTFSGNGTYEGSWGSNTVRVEPRPTKILALTATGYVEAPSLATATLVDVTNPLLPVGISGKTVNFTFPSGSGSGTSGADGTVTAGYTGGASSGTFAYTASFAADGIYASTSATAALVTLPRPVRIDIDPVTAYTGAPFTATATIVDLLNGGRVISGETLQFWFDYGVYRTTSSRVTSNNQAFLAYTAPPSSGPVVLAVTHPEGNIYAAASNSRVVSVMPRPTRIIAESVPGVFADEVFTATATLSDVLNPTAPLPIPGRPVVFHFVNGGSRPATTDGVLGRATTGYTAPHIAGEYGYSASFIADGYYASTSAAAPVTVLKRPSDIETQPVTEYTLNTFAVTAVVTDRRFSQPGPAVPVAPGVRVRFEFDGEQVWDDTNAAGQASANFTRSSSGTYTYRAVVDELDATYLSTDSVNSVTLNPRPVKVVAVSTRAFALEDFAAAATLEDDINPSLSMAGKPLIFYFGSSQTANTDVFGAANATFDAPGSSGTYAFNVTFEPDPTYLGFSTTGVLEADRRPTFLEAENLPTVPTGMPFEVSAQLVDDRFNAPAQSGRRVRFVFDPTGTPQLRDGWTDEVGKATATFDAPNGSGVFTYEAFFDGDFLYEASSDTAFVRTGIPTILVAKDVETYVDDPFSVRAELKDIFENILPGMDIRFTFQAAVSTGVTDALGVATSTFVAPSSSGAYTYEAYFGGHDTYAFDVDEASVTVKRKPTVIAMSNLKADLGQVFEVSASMIDVHSLPVVGRSILFSYDGGTAPGVTDGEGVAVATFTASTTTGAAIYAAVFDGDGTYDSSTATRTVTVEKGATNLVPVEAPGYVNARVELSASLMYAKNSTGIGGRAVVFTFGGADQSATTGANGVAKVFYDAPSSSGTYPYSVRFDEDDMYKSSTGTANAQVTPRPTGLVPVDTKAKPEAVFFTTATLKDMVNSAVVPGKTLTFIFEGSTRTLASDAFGVAVASFTAPASTGTYKYSVAFAGDSAYGASLATGTVIVTGEDDANDEGGAPTLLIVEDVRTTIGEDFTAMATILDVNLKSGVPDLPIVFVFQGSSQTILSNAVGMATATFKAPLTPGEITLEAFFKGTTAYQASSDTAKVLVGDGVIPEDPDVSQLFGESAQASALAWPMSVKSEQGELMTEKVKAFIVERADNMEGPWSRVDYVPSTGTLRYSFTYERPCFYRVRAEAVYGYESKGLKVIRVTSVQEDAGFIYLSEEKTFWVEIPNLMLKKLQQDDPSFGALGNGGPALRVNMTKETVDGYPLAYRVQLLKDGQPLDDGAMGRLRQNLKVVFWYKQMARSAAPALAQAANKQLAVFMHNGVEWVKLGGTKDDLEGSVSIQTRRLGLFAVRPAMLAEKFTLTKVEPRIFSPEEPDPIINSVRLYYENPESEEVTVRIFDIRGAVLRRNLPREGGNIAVWDGRDMDGEIVPAGVYLYQIEVGGKIETGTMAVAK
ncbi:MAG: T9SS type A sorting domain-containing protein, partial [Elusimicrobia bacterium]|nr:T9SS type A sorting domain-containing protein [Elusimicrobiota bacterium]